MSETWKSLMVVGALAAGLGACKSNKDEAPRPVDLDPARQGTGVVATGAPASGTKPSEPVPAPNAASPASPGGAVEGVGNRGAEPSAAPGATGSATAPAGASASAMHESCGRIIDKMVACAKDPGFKKYQRRWTPKGAPAAGSKSFDERILAWGSADNRRADCDTWAKRENAEARIGDKSKLAESLKDTKLSCTLFGQELDDDGWVPAVLRE